MCNFGVRCLFAHGVAELRTSSENVSLSRHDLRQSIEAAAKSVVTILAPEIPLVRPTSRQHAVPVEPYALGRIWKQHRTPVNAWMQSLWRADRSRNADAPLIKHDEVFDHHTPDHIVEWSSL